MSPLLLSPCLSSFMNQPTNAVTFENVSRHFGKVKAVDSVNFEVKDGEFFTFLGPSGSGKTTCLRLIAGFEQPDGGTVYIGSQAANHIPPYERNVHTVFQDYALFPHMSVLDNVAYSMMVKNVAKPERQHKAQEALELVRLSEMGNRRPSQLSGGQRQRVALARALVGRPKILLLDEPLGALDLKLREQMQVELKALQTQVGITFIYVTHDQEEALSMSDRIAVFNQGKIEQLDTPGNIYEFPKTTFVAGFVGTSNLIQGDLANRFASGKALQIRPERIRILPIGASAKAGEVAVHGKVEEAVYLGMQTRYRIRVDTNILLTVSSQNQSSEAALWPVGEKVMLSWLERDMHVLEIRN
jgi:putative spermidine/putrescine transport system ATP-binding protein